MIVKGWHLKSGQHGDEPRTRPRLKLRDDWKEKDDVMVDLTQLHITMTSDLGESQVERLLYIANRCTVHHNLKGGAKIYRAGRNQRVSKS